MCSNAQKAAHLKELMAEIRAIAAKRKAARAAAPVGPLGRALGLLRRA